MKLYPFPKPQMGDRRDFSTSVIRWMGRNALRRLGSEWVEYGPQTAIFDEEELAWWLYRIAMDKGGDRVTDKRDKYWTSVADLERKSLDAARFALNTFDKEELMTIKTRASNGGKKSKRGPKYSVADLLALPAGLSIPQQAEALGCGTATIGRLRAQVTSTFEQFENDVSSAELDALFGVSR